MSYKIRNILAILLFCVFALPAVEAKAQGLVSLSEEAMFDDELESNNDFPALEGSSEKTEEVNAPKPIMPKGPAAEAQKVIPKGPAATAEPKIMPKGPAAEAQQIMPKGPAANVQSDAYSLPPSNKGGVGLFASNIDDDPVSDDLFQQMSDLERKTALLNMELRRERLQNEIEAVKNARRQALAAEEEKAEAQRQKKIEFEKEQERKLLVEQEKLRELDIKFETLRQEKLLSAYKNKMLEETQKWIAHDAGFYKQIADLRKAKKDLINEVKIKMEQVKKEAETAKDTHVKRIEAYKKEAKDLQTQITVLRNRIDALERENAEVRQNPFAHADSDTLASLNITKKSADASNETEEALAEPVETDFSKLYAVTEIRGQGGELIAKLINSNGTTFYVKKGTTLQTGHVIEEITSTYVMAEKAGEKKYLYFAAGGVLPKETTVFEVNKGGEEGDENTGGRRGPVSSKM